MKTFLLVLMYYSNYGAGMETVDRLTYDQCIEYAERWREQATEESNSLYIFQAVCIEEKRDEQRVKDL